MAPTTQREDLKNLAEGMAAMRALLEDWRDESRDENRETRKGLAALGERLATAEEQVRAVKNAAETQARTTKNGYAQHTRDAATIRDDFATFRREVEARFEKVEQGVSAVVPQVADTVVPAAAEAANQAALPQRNKMAKVGQRTLMGVGGLAALAVVKWWVPDAHSLPSYWHFFVHLVNGTDKLVTPPPG